MRRGAAIGALVVALAAWPAVASAPGADDNLAALSARIARPWPGLQRADGSFPDYVLAQEHRPRLQYAYGPAFLGYALLQTGVRDGDGRAIGSGLRALRYAALHPIQSRVVPAVFKTLALASAYNLGREQLTGDSRFQALRPLLADRLQRIRYSVLGRGGHYDNRRLVEAVAVLELVRTGLRSPGRGAVLSDPAAALERARNLINRRLPELTGRIGLLPDPPSNALAYHALSLGLLARALVLLGPQASASAWRTLENGARTSAVLSAPDGDLAYFGRSQEEAWTLPMTAYGAAVAAERLAPTDGREAGRLRALAARALARLRDRYAGGRYGMVITPALRGDLAAGVRGLDSYATGVAYTGLTLAALNWALDAIQTPVAATVPVSASAVRVAHGRSSFAVVRSRRVWFVVREATPRRTTRDLRYDVGVVALEAWTHGAWRDVLPVRPRAGRHGDSAGPSLLIDGHLRRLEGTGIAVRRSGEVDLRGRFAGTRRAALVRYLPVPCGVRLELTTRRGERYEFSAFMRARSLVIRRGRRVLVDAQQRITFSHDARLRFERGLSSGSESDLVRVRLSFRPSAGRPLAIEVCSR